MRKSTSYRLIYDSDRAKIKHRKSVKLKKRNHRHFLGWLKFMNDVREAAIRNSRDYSKASSQHKPFKKTLGPKPEYSETIRYIASQKDAFSDDGKPKRGDGVFKIPQIFSLTDNYAESFSLLKRLFFVLYFQSAKQIYLDYEKCQRIDVDASVCMDILLGEFILHYNACRPKGHSVKVLEITPINFEQEHIRKILFSIGAFANLKGFQINYADIIPFPLCFGIIKHPLASRNREIHITQMVAYVLKCMGKMNRILTAEAEDNLFKVIGEVLVNAEEHSSGDKRFSIGYFQDTQENGQHIGIFNLVILNFGKTIYEMFSDPNCPNQKVVSEMRELSGSYTKKGFFSRAEFEEQTLWTLYALQEGVTSKADWKRGNGSIRFIDSFFHLKGDNEKDNISYLSIVSGNTRITFDGTYRLIDKVKGKNNQNFKMMTFNDTGEIENKPDKKYVTFAKNYFPGTIITAKISIKEINTEESNNNE